MRYAICNETFPDWEHERVCETAARHGYTGLELAPFTLGARITDVEAPRRQEIRRQAESHGLSIIGLHWLLAKTEGFMLTSPDPEVRRRTAAYLGELTRACREFGGDVLVLGSPQQRRVPPGYTRGEAEDFAVDTLVHLLPELDRSQVFLCLEPLAPAETDFMQSAAEAAQIIGRLHHPFVQLHLDVKAMSAEKAPIPEVIREFHGLTRHFHANDPNRRGPGFGDVDFVPIFQALKEGHYEHWVSVEVFDYSPDPETIARESIRYMKECEVKAG